MEKSKYFLLVYGSETGQAQSIAEQIAEKASEFGLQARLHCLEQTGKEVEFDIEKETCMVMVTSTTGDGDAPANASKFLRRIKKRTLPSDYLSHLSYTVLGLGDTNYNNFCKCGRDMDSRLEQLGAKRFYPTGLADDGVGLEIVVEPWLEGLYPALKKLLQKSNGHNPVQDPLSQRLSGIELNNRTECDLNQSNSNGDSINRHFDSNEKSTDSTTVHDNSQICNGSSVDFNTTNNNSQIRNAKTEKKGLNVNNSSDNKDISSLASTSDGLTLGNVGETSSRDVVVSSGDIGVSSKIDSGKVNGTISSQEGVRININDSQAVVVEIDSPLRNSGPSLVDKDLTVPVLAPEFLKAEYSQQAFEVDNLSFQNGCKLPSAASDIIHARISGAKVLTLPDALKKTLWLRLNLQGQGLKYCPGDSISVICQNSRREVDLLLERLQASELADQQMCLSLTPDTKKRRAAVPPHIHPTSTLRHVLTTCVSIRDVPSKAMLRALVEYAADEKEKRRLQEVCSKEGAEEYTKCIREAGISLLDLLYAFPSCKPPVQRVIEFLPRLLPRPYSICSCPESDPDNLDIVFNVVDVHKDVPDGSHYYSRHGVCTGWLDDITSCLQLQESGDDAGKAVISVQIPMFFRTNQHFQPPSDLSKPLILIGPGTGVAPFIGFLQQRALLRSSLNTDEKYGETWLFTGCRHKDKDYLFRENLEEFLATGTLSRLCVSVSRDPESRYRYVQDYMRSEGGSLVTLLCQEEALVYVCGDAKNMSKDVSAVFQEILVKGKEFSPDEANTFLMKKRLHKTYLEDVWT